MNPKLSSQNLKPKTLNSQPQSPWELYTVT
jgi:hypothetical protein